MLLALDFDGVVCDSCGESSLSALKVGCSHVHAAMCMQASCMLHAAYRSRPPYRCSYEAATAAGAVAVAVNTPLHTSALVVHGLHGSGAGMASLLPQPTFAAPVHAVNQSCFLSRPPGSCGPRFSARQQWRRGRRSCWTRCGRCGQCWKQGALGVVFVGWWLDRDLRTF